MSRGKSSATTIDLPEIRMEGVLQDGLLYYRASDVHEWIAECALTAFSHEIPLEVGQYVTGMADAMRRARRQSGL